MPELRVRIANCLIDGELFTEVPQGIRKRDRIELDLDDFSIALHQTEEGMPGGNLHEAIGKRAHTTTLHFGEVAHDDRKKAEEVAADIVWLLRLATLSPVSAFLFEFGAESQSNHVFGTAAYHCPLVDTDGKSIRNFLSATWNGFRALKERRRLPHVIDYLVISEYREQPIEIRTLLLFVALESLKTTHSPGQQGQLARRVRAMLADVGMSGGIEHDLKTLRDSLVHEGIANVPYPTLAAQHERLYDVLQEYLLRLLGFRGRFPLYSARGTQWRGHITSTVLGPDLKLRLSDGDALQYFRTNTTTTNRTRSTLLDMLPAGDQINAMLIPSYNLNVASNSTMTLNETITVELKYVPEPSSAMMLSAGASVLMALANMRAFWRRLDETWPACSVSLAAAGWGHTS